LRKYNQGKRIKVCPQERIEDSSCKSQHPINDTNALTTVTTTTLSSTQSQTYGDSSQSQTYGWPAGTISSQTSLTQNSVETDQLATDNVQGDSWSLSQTQGTDSGGGTFSGAVDKVVNRAGQLAGHRSALVGAGSQAVPRPCASAEVNIR
jgi:hypothetical protein